MNAPLPHRAIVKRHVEALEAEYPIRVLGTLPRGAAAHVAGPDALDLLAEKRCGLDLLGLSEAEATLTGLLGRPVGIVLVSGLKGAEAQELPRSVESL